MFKRYLAMAFAVLIFAAAALAFRVSLEQRALAARLIRLHVVAASDDSADQARKLQVRDALLPRIEALTESCADAASAAAALRAALPALQGLAAEALGTGEPVTADLETESFPRRDYDTFSLPAGPYRALRVTLGAGQGHNWWCVAFPALCLPASLEDFQESAARAEFSEDEIALMTEENRNAEFKFRLLDWLSALFAP